MHSVQTPRLIVTLTLVAILAFGGEQARADVGADAHQIGRAEALFAAGKQRLAYSDYAAACSLFAQSYLIVPATGSLLALALCHERQGKLASALREYEEALERSHDEQRGDREEAARAQIARLKQRVSTLTLRLEEPELRLIVRVNGELVPPARIGKALPMDGGFLLVEAEAEGKITWRTGLTIAESGEALTVSIPLMSPGAASAAPLIVDPPPPPPPPPPAPSVAAAPKVEAPPKIETPTKVEPSKPGRAKLSRLERTGIALLCTGALSAGAAVGFTLRAVSKNRESDQGCVDDVCSEDARLDRLQARGSGNIATVATAAAAALGTSGLIAFLIGARRQRDARAEASRVRASAWVNGNGAGGVFSAGF